MENNTKHTHTTDSIYNYIKNTDDTTVLEPSCLDKIGVNGSQNYYPLLKLLFKLNEGNHNSLLLNHKFQVSKIDKVINGNSIVIQCIDNQQRRQHKKRPIQQPNVNRQCFIKYAPLIDPFHYLCGKDSINDADHTLQTKLPLFDIENTVELKSVINSPFNPAYVDGFFSYLSSQLKNTYDFPNGIDFYGNICGVKTDFKVEISDELTLLNNSTFFMENKNKLFKLDESATTQTLSNISVNSYRKKDPITLTERIDLELDILNDEPLKSFFTMGTSNNNTEINGSLREVVFDNKSFSPSSSCILENKAINIDNSVSNATNSNCSSRTSYTTIETDDNEEADEGEENSDETEICDIYSNRCESDGSSNTDDSDESCDGDESDESDESGEDDGICAYLDHFPVNIIFLEQCDDTLDHYIENNDIEAAEMKSIFIQILFSLATYQHCFNFTHNDLHSNNIMCISTKEKYLYYSLDDCVYKIPTYGKIWKIIDFGRAIYNVSNQTIENTCYSDYGDATTQYNFGRLYCEKYTPREPNKYFDICRLGCSLFDYFFDTDTDMGHIVYDETLGQLVYNDEENAVEDKNTLYTIENLILRWLTVTDNDNIFHNILYKSNGDERYPGFKLYKMIAIKANERCCPVETIKSPYFKEFLVSSSKSNIKKAFNISKLPRFYVDTETNLN